MKEIVKLDNLTIGYGKHAVRKDISLYLSRGKLTSLIGKNGAGKSTLIRTLCGFLPPFSGKITIDGKDIKSISQHHLAKKMSVVLTEMISEINYLTVRQTVEMGRYPYTNCFAQLSKEDHTMVNEALNIVGVAHLADKSIAAISDGQRQKVMIAKALAQNTDIIILDEPLSFLDMPSRIEIMMLLKKIASDNDKAVLLSSHDMELALHFSDSLWVMNVRGAVYQKDAPWGDTDEMIEDVFAQQGKLITDFLKR